MPASLDEVRVRLRDFVAARDWERFHTPKNLAVSIAVEAGELLEQFQWSDPSAEAVRADASLQRRVEEELADVALFALLLGERVGVRLEDAMLRKLERNEERYPAREHRGVARKSGR